MNEKNAQFLLIDKPVGWTSFDVVAYIRKRISQSIQNDKTPPLTLPLPPKAGRHEGETPQHGNDKKKIKVGHAGTLDPFATGLLIVGIGREATKKLDEFKKLPKTYIATIELGAISDTYDVDGTITPTVIPTSPVIPAPDQSRGQAPAGIQSSGSPIKSGMTDEDSAPSLEKINSTLKSFTGKQNQIPPMYSAKKINGQRLYKLARQGKTIERPPSKIEIYNIKVLEYSWPILKIKVQCSAGTYIRSMAHDLGQKLGTGAYCQGLIRTAIGSYELKNAQKLACLNQFDRAHLL